ncbi:MAG: helix-turn-helix domain-containing protein [Micavibrio sp.]|nr:helix-turn-helix domain-containing protein [Micavibrio sp.]
MLSIELCRGARGILGWTQQDLADASGLSKTAINNFEKGHSDIKSESSKAIRLAFESAEIEFLEHNGIRKKSEGMKILRGMNACDLLLDDMNSQISTSDKPFQIINTTGPLYGKVSNNKVDMFYKNLAESNISQKIITSPSIKNKDLPKTTFRYIPENLSKGNVTTYIYANKVAQELWESSMIVLINSADVNDAERCRFEAIWNSLNDS